MARARGAAACVRVAVNRLLAALFEPPCAACGQPIEAPLDGAVCEACWRRVAEAAMVGGGLWRRGGAISMGAAIGRYDGSLRAIIHALKYDRRRSVGPRLGALMREAGAAVLDGADAVVPVPLHPRRRWRRGFNQADLLARTLGVPVLPLLCRVRHTAPQVDLPADRRHANVRHAFALRTKPWWLPERLSPLAAPAGMTLVLVDDVTTTGATLEACASVLARAGARDVRALTAARVATARR